MLQLASLSVGTIFLTMVAFLAQAKDFAAALFNPANGPDTAAHYAGLDPANISRVVGDASQSVMSMPGDMASVWNTWQLSITLNTNSMFDGAQLIIDALGGPYLYIAGLALGASILGAIIAAVSRIRI